MTAAASSVQGCGLKLAPAGKARAGAVAAMKRKMGKKPGASQGMQALLAAAVRHLQSGRLNEARATYLQLLAAEPDHCAALHHLAIVEYQLGRSDEALRLLRRCLAVKPGYAQAVSDLAVILMQLGRDEEAIAACRTAISLDATLAAAHGNLGDLMQRKGDPGAAEPAYAKAVALHPGFAAAHAGRADALVALGRLGDAQAACQTAIRLAPALAQAYGVKGLILHRQDKLADAIAAYEHALRLDPALALVHTRLGTVFQAERRFDEAFAANARAIEIDPNCAEAHCNQGLVLQATGRRGEALAAYRHALALKPGFVEALVNMGPLLHRAGRPDEALAALREAVQIAPGADFALISLGSMLKDQGQVGEAVDVYRKLLALPEPPASAQYDYCNLRRHICDWQGLEEAERRAIAAARRSGKRVQPFAALAMACSPEDHLALARNWAKGFTAEGGFAPRWVAPEDAGQRIRVGFLSSDFFQHATANLIAELIERFDRDRFTLFAYCLSPDDGSPMRRRLMTAFDRFTVVTSLPDAEAAMRIAADGIDILIDLKGYTRDAPSAIMAHRPAPIQVNYLGYPSTMGADFIDYIIADPFIAPMDHQRFFDERIVQLPECYQPNDRLRKAAEPAPTRAQCGLPAGAFVFCSFNNAYKITEPVFSVWMRLLSRVPGSTLWLLGANPLATANLLSQAAARGVDPARLVFAPKLPTAEHLARYALADLFLDNLPVNAHTTASEALWCGLPVITCAGEIFVGRVAGSLLHACGLSELVTRSLQDYEALALKLATDRPALRVLRGRLERDRLTAPLFDIERYARNLEAAFAQMQRLHRGGRPPEAFAVADLAGAG
jgi:protein O-GlcNAc transferase